MRRAKTKNTLLRILWFSLCGLVTAVVICLALVMYRPGEYKPLKPTNGEQVSPYLTHYLAPNFHNNIQIDRPFEIIVDQAELNKLIADGQTLGWTWPVILNGVAFHAPMIVLDDEEILLMGKVDIGLPVVVTIVIAPEVDDRGLFHLNIRRVSAGAMNITALAQKIGGRIMAAQAKNLKEDQWLRDLSGAFLQNKPYEPAYPVPLYKKYIRLSKVGKHKGELLLFFTPAGAMPGQCSSIRDQK